MHAPLLHFDHLEPWQRDNPCIRSGYRPLTRSVRGALRTVVGWHNESVNIVRPRLSLPLDELQADGESRPQWTHLGGAAVAVATVTYLLLDLSPADSLAHHRKGWFAPFAGIPYPFPNAAQPSVTWADAVGFAAFLLSATACLGASSRTHPSLSADSKLMMCSPRPQASRACSTRCSATRRRSPCAGTASTISASSSSSRARSSRQSTTASSVRPERPLERDAAPESADARLRTGDAHLRNRYVALIYTIAAGACLLSLSLSLGGT